MTSPAPAAAAISGESPPVLDRRGAAGLALGGALALAVLAWWLVPWQWLPGRLDLPQVQPTDLFTAAQIDRAEHHSWVIRILAWSGYALSLTLAVALGLSPYGARLVRRLRGRGPWWSGVIAGTVVLLLLGRLLTLPLRYAGYRENVGVGLSTQSPVAWLGDQGLGFLVTAAVTSLALLVIVGVARRAPRRWFVIAGAGFVGLTFAVSMVYPVVVEPLFNDFTPMASGPLRSDIEALADSEGVPLDDVLVADASRRTTALNAYVSGFGATRRVVVYDTLLNDLDRPQVLSVIAHELGHARDHDVVVGTTMAACGGVVGVSLLALLLDARWLRRRASISGPGDPGSVALILAVVAVGGLVVSPAQNTISRAVEARADVTALRATADPDSFQRLQVQLSLRSYADPTPPRWSQFWFGSHPTVLQRVALARAFTENRGGLR